MTFKRGIDKSLRPSLEREKPPSLPIVQQPAAGTVEYRKAEGILVLISPGFPENAAQDFPVLRDAGGKPAICPPGSIASSVLAKIIC